VPQPAHVAVPDGRRAADGRKSHEVKNNFTEGHKDNKELQTGFWKRLLSGKNCYQLSVISYQEKQTNNE
jgi:hypothetical protein